MYKMRYRHDYAVCGCGAASQRAACDEVEHGLRHTGATPTRASLTSPLGTLLQTPRRRTHLAVGRDLLGSRTSWCEGVQVSRFFPLVL